jgi:uncharacterized protein (DUF1786 family)
MATALLAFHVVVAVQDHGFSFPLSEMQNLFTMIVWLTSGISSL